MFVVVQSQPEAVNRRLVVWRVRDGRAAMTPLSASQRHASLLKQKTLDALTRLGDRDTARVAVHELTRLITSMPPEHLPVVVQCLCDESAAAPKPTARREVLRLFETVADAQREHALPHLPRLVAATIRRMKDPDPIVGDACVETLGALAEAAARLPPSISRAVLSGPDAVGPHFVRPVIDAMHETNSRNAQDVACRALARVFRRCGPGRGGTGAPAGANWFPDGGPGRLALKLASMLSAPNFYAKAALVQAIAALFAAAAFAVGPQLPALLGVAAAANANARAGAERSGLLEGESANPRDDAGFRGGANEANGANGGEDEGAVGETIDEEAEIEAEDGANAGALAEDSAPTDGKKDKRLSAANVGERVASSETATVFPGGLLDATGSHDWPVRRAAAEAITVLLCDLGPGLENETVTPVPLVDAIERVLETRRHDKVKPARDAVCTALSVVDALRRYAAEKLPLHDVAMWRRWVRTELGQDVGSLGEDGHAAALVDLRRAARDPRGAKENTRPGRITLEYVRDPTTETSDPVLKAERVIRRKKLSPGFRRRTSTRTRLKRSSSRSRRGRNVSAPPPPPRRRRRRRRASRRLAFHATTQRPRRPPGLARRGTRTRWHRRMGTTTRERLTTPTPRTSHDPSPRTCRKPRRCRRRSRRRPPRPRRGGPTRMTRTQRSPRSRTAFRTTRTRPSGCTWRRASNATAGSNRRRRGGSLCRPPWPTSAPTTSRCWTRRTRTR